LKVFDADDLARRYFPDKPETKVPLAIGLAVIMKSAEEAALMAANIGGDADSVASIGGAIAGALDPATINQGWFDIVSSVNDDDLPTVASSVAALRS
jgi:ADP-ribosylglycohydrolase